MPGTHRKDKGKAAPPGGEELRVDPENRLCARFDAAGIAKYPVAGPEQMGVRVLDDCPEEHQM